MLGIGTLVAIACLKQPMHFQNPGTMWRDKLCVLFFLKAKSIKTLCRSVSAYPCSRCVSPSLSIPLPPRACGNIFPCLRNSGRVTTEIYLRTNGISASPAQTVSRKPAPRSRHKVRMAWREASARLTDCHPAPVASFLQTPFPAKHLFGQQYIKTYRHG